MINAKLYDRGVYFIFYFIYLFELFWLLTDMTSGFLKITYGLDLGQYVRMVLFPIILYILMIYSNKRLFFLGLISSLFFLSSLHMLFESIEINSIKMIFKILLPILLIFVVEIQIQKGMLNQHQVNKIIIFNAFILLINLYLTYLGIGYSNYGVNIDEVMQGGTGFFYAGNEVNGTMLILNALVYLVFYKQNFIKLLIIFFLFLLGGVLLMSKTAIFGTILLLLFMLASRYNISEFLSQIIVISIFLFITLTYLLYDRLVLAIERWSYFSNEYGISTYFLGGIKRWRAINDYINDLTFQPIKLLIGFGWNGECENNFFDLIQAFGIVGLLIFLFWIFLVFKYIRLFYINRVSEYLFITITLILIIIVGFFAGHIMQSAMLSFFIALLVNFNLILKRNTHEKL